MNIIFLQKKNIIYMFKSILYHEHINKARRDYNLDTSKVLPTDKHTIDDKFDGAQLQVVVTELQYDSHRKGVINLVELNQLKDLYM